MVHLIHRKLVPLLHSTVLILCDDGDGLGAMISERDRKSVQLNPYHAEYLYIIYKNLSQVLGWDRKKQTDFYIPSSHK